ncbi:RNI-like protein [Gigaspora margarita]|uniref:RNI-like protein n=1 Tax=Gigaspora margarita TaxID=4874 RepID=A0A8H4EUX6_GIGMA|nr:RNI-like protein [Gigaspora margarita]
MIPLPNECLHGIFSNIKGQHNNLFSCLLVNRQWCVNVLPILWNELDVFWNWKLVRTCLLALNSEERAQLEPFKIILPKESKLLFEYTSYIKTIKIDSDDGFRKLNIL